MRDEQVYKITVKVRTGFDPTDPDPPTWPPERLVDQIRAAAERCGYDPNAVVKVHRREVNWKREYARGERR